MTKTKYLLYAFKCFENGRYSYWYRTDEKYFKGKKPPKSILDKVSLTSDCPTAKDIIANPWANWEQNDTQKITSDSTCINYLSTTNSDIIEIHEDKKLLETYSNIVHHFDITKSFGFKMIEKWHKQTFQEIYPFAGQQRTVEMTKGTGDEVWAWRLEFLSGIPELNELIKSITKKKYTSLDALAKDLSILISEFLFIHPFREGNGRISRLLADIILAKNGFPMIGLKLKKGGEHDYIERIHQGYQKNYEPLAELLKQKIEEEITIRSE